MAIAGLVIAAATRTLCLQLALFADSFSLADAAKEAAVLSHTKKKILQSLREQPPEILYIL
jgi:hypothetical protein